MRRANVRIERSLGLDLLRAIAILLVIVCHFSGYAAPAFGYTQTLPIILVGHLGVALFFVLSGFLIGGMLADIAEQGPTPQSWAIFMTRRVMRTMPAYFLWVVLLIACKPSGQWQPYLAQYLTFTQNLSWPMPPSGWFAVSWSLAVE